MGGHDGKPCEIEWKLSQPVAWPSDKPLNLILEQNHGSEHLLRGFQLSLAFSRTPTQQLAAEGREQAEQSFSKWLDATREQVGSWRMLKPRAVSANMARLEPQSDGSYLAIGDISKRDEYQFQLDLEPGTTALMIEGMVDPSLPKRGPGRTYYEGPIGDFFLSEVSVKGPRDSTLAIRQAWVDFALSGREAEKSLDGDPLTGWSIDGQQGVPHRMVVALKDPLDQPTLATLVLLFERYYAAPLGRVRVWSSTANKIAAPAAQMPPDLQNQLVNQPREQLRSGPVWDWFLMEAPELAAFNARIKDLQKVAGPSSPRH